MKQIRYKHIFGKINFAAAISCLLFVFFFGAFGQTGNQSGDFKILPIQALKKGERLERPLKKNEFHPYLFSLKRGDLIRLKIEHQNIAVSLIVVKKGEEKTVLKNVGDEKKFIDKKDFVFMAETDGEFLFGVIGLEENAPESQYVLQNDAPFADAEEKKSAASDLDKSGISAFHKKDYQTAILYHQHAADLLKDLPPNALSASILNNLADDFYNARDYQKALENYRQAAAIFEKSGDAGQATYVYYNIASVLQIQQDFEKSNAFYQKSLPLLVKADDKYYQARTLWSIGENYKSLRDYEKSNDFFEQSLAAARISKDRSLEGSVLFGLAGNYFSLENFVKALDFYQQSLLIFRELKETENEAIALSNVGLTYARMEKPNDALNFLNQSQKMSAAIKNSDFETKNQTILAEIYTYIGRGSDAIKLYEKIIKTAQTNGDQTLESDALRGIGFAYGELGDYEKALEFHRKVFEIAVAKKDETGQIVGFGSFALAYMELGKYDLAFEYNQKALELARRLKSRLLERMILNNIGVAYLRLGSVKKAETHILEAEKLSRELKDFRGIAVALSNLGTVYTKLKQYDKAIDYFERAMPLLKEQKNYRFQVTTNYYHGTVRRERGELEKAVALHTEAVKIAREAHTPKFEARSQIELALDLLAQNKIKDALLNFQAALIVAREVKAREEESAALDGLMQSYQTLKQNPLAIFYGKQSINILQSIRGEIVKFDKDIQSNYLNDNQQTYRTLADLLIKEGRIAEAEQILRMLKEEEFYAYLRRDDAVAKDLLGKLSLTPDETAAFKRYGELADRTTAAGQELGDLQKESLEYEAGKYPKQARLDELEKQIADANRVFNAFLEELNVKFKNNATGQTDVRVDVVSNTQTLLKELNEPRTVVISTIAGEDKLNLIVTTADANRAHTVEINQADLNKLILDFREAVRNPEVDPRVLGKKLYDVLFPNGLRTDLDGVNADTIVWSLDGTLRYAPLAALWDGKNYLAERYANVVITLASRDKLLNQPTNRKSWTALGVGVSKPFENFSALAAVPEELCSVINDLQSKTYCDALKKSNETGVLTGKILPDEKFSLADFKANLGRYKIVHIASHFSLNAGNESDSFLLLGEGKTPDERKLSLAAVRDQFASKFVGVELLTLSACNTAMSAGNKSNGLEVEGFGALAQRQGAKSVMATLWAVADPSTRDLMSNFYKNLEENAEISKAEALRKAQISLMLGKNKFLTDAELARRSEAVRFGASQKNLPKFKKDENAPFAHPYYWSPFVLIGNWR